MPLRMADSPPREKLEMPLLGSMVLSEVLISGSGSATVQWSKATSGGTALAVGSAVSLPSSITSNSSSCTSSTTSNPVQGCYLILGSATYNFNPLNFYYQANAITLSDSLYLAPRAAALVKCSGC